MTECPANLYYLTHTHTHKHTHTHTLTHTHTHTHKHRHKHTYTYTQRDSHINTDKDAHTLTPLTWVDWLQLTNADTADLLTLGVSSSLFTRPPSAVLSTLHTLTPPAFHFKPRSREALSHL